LGGGERRGGDAIFEKSHWVGERGMPGKRSPLGGGGGYGPPCRAARKKRGLQNGTVGDLRKKSAEGGPEIKRDSISLHGGLPAV